MKNLVFVFIFVFIASRTVCSEGWQHTHCYIGLFTKENCGATQSTAIPVSLPCSPSFGGI